jgi:hypothetical protein
VRGVARSVDGPLHQDDVADLERADVVVGQRRRDALATVLEDLDRHR